MLGVGRGGPRGPAWEDVGGPGSASSGVSGDVGREPGAAAGMVDDAERDAWVVLNEATGVGPATFERLISAFGSALEVLRTASGPHAAELLTSAVADADGSPALPGSTAHEIRAAASRSGPVLTSVRRAGLSVLVRADAAYPARLRRVGLPPPV